MPDFNKGDFTQQGVNGHVNATVRLNEKRLVNIDLTSNEEAEGCTIAGAVTDLLNDKVYPIGAGVSGNIEITENGENINVAPYATATVNVSGGGDLNWCSVTVHNDTEEPTTIYGISPVTQHIENTPIAIGESATFLCPYIYDDYYGGSHLVIGVPASISQPMAADSTTPFTDLNNITLYEDDGYYTPLVIASDTPSSLTVQLSILPK